MARTSGPRDPVDNGPDPSATDAASGADDARVAEAADRLYALEPARFMAERTALAKQAKDAGAAPVGKRIAALRKPTVAASIVNRLVLDDPSTVADVLDLGERLRFAQDALDATLLRELSGERRALVRRLCAAALELTGTADPSTAVRDEITSTLDAAIADPDVADRLGRLERSESWSGFGFGPAGDAPELTLVRGGRDRTRRRATSKPGALAPDPPAKSKAPPVARRRSARALEKARDAFDSAETSLASAQKEEESQAGHVRELTDELSRLQGELTEAKRSLEQARREARSARTRRREARSALDRAERQADS